jgi:hypothetical protein
MSGPTGSYRGSLTDSHDHSLCGENFKTSRKAASSPQRNDTRVGGGGGGDERGTGPHTQPPPPLFAHYLMQTLELVEKSPPGSSSSIWASA